MKLVLLRHGQTAWNRENIIIGQKDVPLETIGRQQALQAALLLENIELDAIYSSPLIRSHETAQIIGAHLGLDVILVPDLIERNWGVFEGRPRHERDKDIDPENGEKTSVFLNRVDYALKMIKGKMPLLVTHSGVIRAITQNKSNPIPHASPIMFEIN